MIPYPGMGWSRLWRTTKEPESPPPDKEQPAIRTYSPQTWNFTPTCRQWREQYSRRDCLSSWLLMKLVPRTRQVKARSKKPCGPVSASDVGHLTYRGAQISTDLGNPPHRVLATSEKIENHNKLLVINEIHRHARPCARAFRALKPY